MRRSASIAIGIVQAVAAAALAAGCGSRGAEGTWENCVDRTGRVVDPQQCAQEQPRWRSPGYIPYFHWYYTRGARPLTFGAPAYGGTVVRPAGAVSHSSDGHAVSRGGFGSTGAAHSSSGA